MNSKSKAAASSNDHFVPQHFLRGWSHPTDENKMGRSYRRISHTGSVVTREFPSIVTSASQNNLNSYTVDGKHVSFEDDITKNIDTPGAPVIQALRTSGLKSLNNILKIELCKYIFTLESRNPSVMSAMDASVDDIMNGIKGSREGLADARAALEKIERRGALISGVFASWGHRRFSRVLRELEWAEIRAPNACEFVTSEYPVGRLGSYEDPSNLVVFIAISPSLAIAIASAKHMRVILKEEPVLRAQTINLLTISRAERGFSQSTKEDPFIKAHLGWMLNLDEISPSAYFVNALESRPIGDTTS